MGFLQLAGDALGTHTGFTVNRLESAFTWTNNRGAFTLLGLFTCPAVQYEVERPAKLDRSLSLPACVTQMPYFYRDRSSRYAQQGTSRVV